MINLSVASGPANIRIYDAPEYYDRYTIVVEEADGTRTFHGANEDPFHPLGFGQFCGDGCEEGPHLGKEIDFSELPEPTQRFARQRAA